MTRGCQRHSYIKLKVLIRDEDPVLAKKPDPGLCTSNEGRCLKVYFMNILDYFKSLLFCFHTFGVRRTIDFLHPEISPDPDLVKFGPDPGL